MKIGYFPGCSLHGTARELDESLKAISDALGVQLQEVEDWSCCGATSGHATDHLLSVALAARNLALAEAQGMDQVLAPCAACFSRLATARHEVQNDESLRDRLPQILGRPFANTVTVRNLVDVLRTMAPDIKAKATKPLNGMKVACYYGCLLVRPPEVACFDDPEQPTSMEEVVKAAGGTPVAWNRRMDCCGGAFSLSRTGSVIRLGRAILDDVRAAGADAVAVACPMCHSNLDFRQSAMALRGEALMPVFFLTELVGMALGLESKALGIQRHFVSAAPLLERQCAAGRGVS